ncbi:hypothetical protein DFH11DRAFT_1776364 [Phellopilus nigrolimitatus]|nr:hypothetical protein DFH11DRAFT_1776364 [Phellopilus nigrolimitatus]
MEALLCACERLYPVHHWNCSKFVHSTQSRGFFWFTFNNYIPKELDGFEALSLKKKILRISDTEHERTALTNAIYHFETWRHLENFAHTTVHVPLDGHDDDDREREKSPAGIAQRRFEHNICVRTGFEHAISVGIGFEHSICVGIGAEHGISVGIGSEHAISVGSCSEHGIRVRSRFEHSIRVGTVPEHDISGIIQRGRGILQFRLQYRFSCVFACALSPLFQSDHRHNDSPFHDRNTFHIFCVQLV